MLARGWLNSVLIVSSLAFSRATRKCPRVAHNCIMKLSSVATSGASQMAGAKRDITFTVGTGNALDVRTFVVTSRGLIVRTNVRRFASRVVCFKFYPSCFSHKRFERNGLFPNNISVISRLCCTHFYGRCALDSDWLPTVLSSSYSISSFYRPSREAV